MPIQYDPGITYRGGDYLFQGISNLGQGIAQGIQDFTREHQKIAIADEVMQQLAQTPDPSDPEGKRAIVDPKTYERFLAAKGQQRAAVAEGLLQKIAVESRIGRTPQYVTVNIGGRQLNVSPGMAAQVELEKERQGQRVPTKVGEDVIALTPEAAARAKLAQMPRAPTPQQQADEARKQRAEQQKELERLPEYQFQKKYQLQPRDVLADTKTGYESKQVKNAQGQQVTQWIPTTNIFREKKYEQQGGATYLPDPEGEILNFKGQRIPYDDFKKIQNRAAEVYKFAKDALARGVPADTIRQRILQMGFDPSQVQ